MTQLHPIVRRLVKLRFPNAFNPYADECAVFDGRGAARTRAKLLSRILDAAECLDVESIWVARDLGYRGGRRTGLALTDDVHLSNHLSRWGIEGARPTIGESVSERTASVVWNLLDRIPSHVFLWNVFPLHPHEKGNEFSNRAHTAAEREAGLVILREIVGALRPRTIFAIGNDAAAAMQKCGLNIEVVQARHPSYGGQGKFVSQVVERYSLSAQSQMFGPVSDPMNA